MAAAAGGVRESAPPIAPDVLPIIKSVHRTVRQALLPDAIIVRKPFN
jgi:hypothetical protein